VPDPYRSALLSYGIDLAGRHGGDSWLLPLPGILVAGADGTLRSAKAGGDVAERAGPKTILSLLDGMAQDKDRATA